MERLVACQSQRIRPRELPVPVPGLPPSPFPLPAVLPEKAPFEDLHLKCTGGELV